MIKTLENQVSEIVDAIREAIPQSNEPVSLSRFAEMTGIHVSELRRYCRDGKIPSHAIPGTYKYLIYLDEVRDALPNTAEYLKEKGDVL